MSKMLDDLVERSVGALIHDALSNLPSHVYEAATGTKLSTKSTVTKEAIGSVTVSERPQIPGENDIGFLPLTIDYYNNTYVSLDQLRAIRDISRLLYYGNEIVRNAISNRVNFVVGEGLTYRLLPKNVSTSPKELVKYALEDKEDTKISKMMENWSAFVAKNNFDKRLRNWATRAHRDGEVLVRIFNTPVAPTIRFIYPDYLEAKDANSPTESYSIRMIAKRLWNTMFHIRTLWILKLSKLTRSSLINAMLTWRAIEDCLLVILCLAMFVGLRSSL